MPTYDYRCEACGHAFEHFQSMTSERLRDCPACKRRTLVRLVGAGAGVIFKGSGFYETDYKRAGKPAEEGPAPAAVDPGKEQAPQAGSGAAEGSGGRSTPADSTSGTAQPAGPKARASRSGGSKSSASRPGGKGPGSSKSGPAKD